MMSVFAPTLNMPEIGFQGTPSVIATPSSSVPHKAVPMVTPIAPISTQFGAGSTSIKGVRGADYLQGCVHLLKSHQWKDLIYGDV